MLLRNFFGSDWDPENQEEARDAAASSHLCVSTTLISIQQKKASLCGRGSGAWGLSLICVSSTDDVLRAIREPLKCAIFLLLGANPSSSLHVGVGSVSAPSSATQCRSGCLHIAAHVRSWVAVSLHTATCRLPPDQAFSGCIQQVVVAERPCYHR
mmetsp:Transcript_14146/g.21111  ORF Transcript_14146/g.21111 Transcript_14146/m.21111 type:complete len:155 (+) Transcript_14146:358-822(+)